MQIRSRRDFLTWWLKPLTEEPPPPQPPKAPKEYLPVFLRPPGALPEPEFLAACERCTKCKDACPHDVILPLGPAYEDADGTPAILPRGEPCRLCPDLPCAAACPTGALKVIPIAEVRMGTAVLDESRCWAAMNQPCDYCIKECPLGSAALRMTDGKPEIVAESCAGCGMCIAICTATPAAIRIEPLDPRPDGDALATLLPSPRQDSEITGSRTSGERDRG